jgi:hypothetical protein
MLSLVTGTGSNKTDGTSFLLVIDRRRRRRGLLALGQRDRQISGRVGLLAVGTAGAVGELAGRFLPPPQPVVIAINAPIAAMGAVPGACLLRCIPPLRDRRTPSQRGFPPRRWAPPDVWCAHPCTSVRRGARLVAMSRRPKRRRFRASGRRVSHVLSEFTLNVRMAAWLGRQFGRLVRRDVRRQLALVQRRLR